MKINRNKRWAVNAILLLAVILGSSSCITYKKIRYFETISKNDEYKTERTTKTIQSYDKLYIKVYGIDEKTSKIFNGGESFSGFMNVNLLNFVVNENGNIMFPFVGLIKVADMTVEEAGKQIKEKLNNYVVNADVIVKFVENRVSVIGEVQRQGDYTFYEDKLSVFQVLAMAGGLSRYGDHRKVILIRKRNDVTKYYTIDLSNKHLVQDETYYISSNDVLVVEPLKAVTWSYQNATVSTVLSSIATLATVLTTYTILKK